MNDCNVINPQNSEFTFIWSMPANSTAATLFPGSTMSAKPPGVYRWILALMRC